MKQEDGGYVRLLVTSGGTREPIDEVRYIGNVSSGRTGAWIVEEALRRYHTVHWLRAGHGEGPTEWMVSSGLLDAEAFGSSGDLKERVLRRLGDYQYDAVVHAAAVADYTVSAQSGKVPSTLAEWTLKLTPAPKVVDAMVPYLQGALLVVFKLEAVADEEELLRRGRATLERTGAGLVVANGTQGLGSVEHSALISDGTTLLARAASRRELAVRLVELLEERCSKSI